MERTFETTIGRFDSETGIGYVTLDRPDSLNALSTGLREDLIATLQWLDDCEPDSGGPLRAVVLEGADGNFCAGADINEFEGTTEEVGDSARSVFEFVVDYPAPVIAKIRGYCLGGGLELAMSCDFRFAHEDARLGLPEVDLGILPGAGGVQFVSRLANPAVAKELAMTGDHVEATRANHLGLLNDVYEDDLDDATQEFAVTIAAKPPLAIRAIKESATVAVESGLREGRRFDHTMFQRLRETEDHQRGVRAFAEDDYEPVFEGQ